MAKPRRKVIRRVAPKKDNEHVNPEIQRLLDKQAERRRALQAQSGGEDDSADVTGEDHGSPQQTDSYDSENDIWQTGDIPSEEESQERPDESNDQYDMALEDLDLDPSSRKLMANTRTLAPSKESIALHCRENDDDPIILVSPDHILETDPMHMCGNKKCNKYSVAADTSFIAPGNCILIKKVNAEDPTIDPKELIQGFYPSPWINETPETPPEPIVPIETYRLTDYQYLVHLYHKGFSIACDMTSIWTFDKKIRFEVEILTPPIREIHMMLDILGDPAMLPEGYEDEDDLEELERDPPVVGGLIPGLRRSDYANPIELESFCFEPTPDDMRMLAILSS